MAGLVGCGYEDRPLTGEETRLIVAQALESLELAGKRVLVIIPDLTRSAPIPEMFQIFQELLNPCAAALDYLVALGTHPALDDAALSRLVGQAVVDGMAGNSHIFNHRWDEPETFVTLGTIPAAKVHQVTEGRFSLDVPVTVNRLVLDYDQVVVCGPTTPHESVGFSGGNKYFFPGICGPEVIDIMHWLAAVITSLQIIGIADTPVRNIIDTAADMIDRPKLCFSMVVRKVAGQAAGLAGLYAGTPKVAFAAAAELSSRVHIEWVDRQYDRVLSIIPQQYDDLWTGSKGMFKIEPVVADGGEVILYAPHIDELSYSHGPLMDKIGFHVRDYLLDQWDRFKDYPWLALAHSALVKGSGTCTDGREQPRIQVTLASRVPPQRCEQVGLGYINPDSIEVQQWQGRQDEGILVVPSAGEVLYRPRGS